MQVRPVNELWLMMHGVQCASVLCPELTPSLDRADVGSGDAYGLAIGSVLGYMFGDITDPLAYTRFGSQSATKHTEMTWIHGTCLMSLTLIVSNLVIALVGKVYEDTEADAEAWRKFGRAAFAVRVRKAEWRRRESNRGKTVGPFVLAQVRPGQQPREYTQLEGVEAKVDAALAEVAKVH
jgi:hypothetical protein